MYAARSIRGRRGFYGLGAPTQAPTATSREIGPGRYTTELRPFGISAAEAPRVPQRLITALKRRFGEVGQFNAGWGSGAQRGKIWVIFSTSPQITDEGRAQLLAEAVAEAAGASGGMLVLPGGTYSGGIPAALALPADLATIPARDLQAELVRAGFSVGPAGVDGDFGTDSRAALTAAGERLGIRDGVAEITRSSVTLTVLFWEAIQALPDADAPSEPRRTPRPAPVPVKPETRGSSLTRPASEKTDWTWWLVGAAALGLGGLWFFSRKRKRAA